MTRHLRHIYVVICGLCVCAAFAARPSGAATAPAGETAGSARDEALAARQALVRERLAQLEDRLFRLSQRPGDLDADRRQRLEEALRRSRELLIRRAMDEAVRALQQADLSTAVDRQEAAARALEQVLELLLKEPDPTAALQAQQRRLAGRLEEVRALIARQRELLARTGEQAAASNAAAAEQVAAGLAAAQRDLQQATAALAAREAADRSRDMPAGGSETPAAAELSQAAGHMGDAAGALEQGRPAGAARAQQRAVESLEKAAAGLERMLREAEQELSELFRRVIEQRLRAMVGRQTEINDATAAADRSTGDTGRKPDRRLLDDLGHRQEQLAAEARDLLDMLARRDDVVALPLLLEMVHADMKAAALRLKGAELGETTLGLQQRILESLRGLLESLEFQPPGGENASGESSPSDAGTPTSSLMPPLAELKLLRAAQARLIAETVDLEQAGQMPVDDRAAALRDLGGRQHRLAEAARRLAKNLEKP